MTTEAQLMADAKFYESYSRFLPDLNRFETWNEAVERVMNMHRTKYKDEIEKSDILAGLIDEVERAYKEKKILGAQRALQFGGEQLLLKNARLYNCTASYCDRVEFFKEAFWLMLCGCGVGFSVQKEHIKHLPTISPRVKQAKTFIVEDSIEGWAEALNVLLLSYFDIDSPFRSRKIYFDLSKIRPKGAYISGGFKAPGPEPLRKALDKIEFLLTKETENGTVTMRPIIAYDIMMHAADAVISGGVRRAATICIFSPDDTEMLTAKTGNWFVENPQRGRSNNSVLLLRDKTTREQFHEIMQSVKDYGEPGFVWADDIDYIVNPCVEVGMYCRDDNGKSGFQMCNLTEINGGMSETKEVFFEQCKYASILGTLQAGYTDFAFLSDSTKKIVEREALIGVGITGFMNNPKILFDPEIQRQGAEIVKKWNKITAKLIGINQAARTTVVKPSGNASVLLGTASGIHGEHAPRYLRHVQMNKTSEIAQLFQRTNPRMVEESVWSDTDIVVAFPIEPKAGSIFKRDLLGVKQLEYVKLTQMNWIASGTNKELCVKPFLTHNVSNTITVDNWDDVENYIYNNREFLCGVSLLAAAGDKAYPQAPFTEVLTHTEILEKYGTVALFASGLIEAGLNAWDGNLWLALDTALGFGETLDDTHKDLLKRDFVRRFKKFSRNFVSENECANCLKDVYNLHKFWKIKRDSKPIDWAKELTKREYTDIDTIAAEACAGGKCEL